MEDESFAKMMETREAAKTRGYPSGFQKSQCLGGAKPGNMGRDKDWPMPKEIPKAKTDDDTKSKEIKKADVEEAEEIGHGKKNKMRSPLEGDGNLTERTMKSAGEIPSFKDMMSIRKTMDIGQMTGLDVDAMYPQYTPLPKNLVQTTLDVEPKVTQMTLDTDTPEGFFGTDKYISDQEAAADRDVVGDAAGDAEKIEDDALQGVEDYRSLVDGTLSDRATKELPGGSAKKWQRRMPHGYESSASNKNSKYKNIDRKTERKP